MGDLRRFRHSVRRVSAACAVVPAVAALGVTAAQATGTPSSRQHVPLIRLSQDPFHGAGQHSAEVEPDSFAHGNTIVAAFQEGRFSDGGSRDIGYARSNDSGVTWQHGSLPDITDVTGHAYDRVSDPSVAYSEKFDTWLIGGLGINGAVGHSVIVSRSTDGAQTWQTPNVVAASNTDFLDKDWVVCDNSQSSPYYGNCYAQWDDNSQGNLIQMSTSHDGGITWSAPAETADAASGLGGQPLVAPDGRVIVIASGDLGLISYTSTDGGATWSASSPVPANMMQTNFGGLRADQLPSAEIDASGRVYAVWQACEATWSTKSDSFGAGCSRDGIYMSTTVDGQHWTKPSLVPVDPKKANVDHFIPSIGVDPATQGDAAHLAVSYYYYPKAGCYEKTCRLMAGFTTSSDSGKTWTKRRILAGPMNLSWLAKTTLGPMVGDYMSTSFVNGRAFPMVVVASRPKGGVLNEAVFTTEGGIGF